MQVYGVYDIKNGKYVGREFYNLDEASAYADHLCQTSPHSVHCLEV